MHDTFKACGTAEEASSLGVIDFQVEGWKHDPQIMMHME